MTRLLRAQHVKGNSVLTRGVNNELLRKIPLNCRFNLISLRSLESPGGRECFCTLPRGAHEHASRSILFRGSGVATLSCRHGGKIGITRNATPCHAEAAQRNKTREMRRCDTRLDPTAIICSNRVEQSHAAPTRRVDHSQLTLPLATAVKLYPSRTFCLPSAWASRVY